MHIYKSVYSAAIVRNTYRHYGKMVFSQNYLVDIGEYARK